MTDIVSPAVRSRMMAGIRGKDTRPEILVRKALFAAGYRFRLHRKDLPGKPDIVLPSRRIAIFSHGCFWHQHGDCKLAKMPSSNINFWKLKLSANRARDVAAIEKLKAIGWRTLVVWECATRNTEIAADLPGILSAWIESEDSEGNISANGN